MKRPNFEKVRIKNKRTGRMYHSAIRGPIRRLTAEEYDQAIKDLEDAKTQLDPDGRNCAVCEDGCHQAWECHHNPLVAKNESIWLRSHHWRCYFCDMVFHDPKEAEEHFGRLGSTDFPRCVPRQVWKVHVRATGHTFHFAFKPTKEEILIHLDEKYPTTELKQDQAPIGELLRLKVRGGDYDLDEIPLILSNPD